jgi:hypothetical protein
MWANYLLGPLEPGKRSFWTAANGEFSLPWGDGSESALRLRVDEGNPSSPYAVVQWRHRDHPFLSRIDAVRAERTPRDSIDARRRLRDSSSRGTHRPRGNLRAPPTPGQ